MGLMVDPGLCGTTYRGEHGKEVYGCQCKGMEHTHGHCGFHKHIFSNEDKPWCRTKHGCGQSGFRGSWMYCNALGLERRRADDGQLYHVRDFTNYFKKSADS